MTIFELVGKFVIENAEANKALDNTSNKAKDVNDAVKETADQVKKSNRTTQDSNKKTETSWKNLKAKVAEYKSQGLSTSQAWRQVSKDMQSSTEDAESGITKAFKKIGTAIATFLAIEKIKEFGEACITAAADANAMESQFAQVFGTMEDTASESLSNIADTAGISENRIKGSFTKIASFAKTTGMDTEEALSLSERAMVAVADSAAFYDRTLEETTESLQSFLKGNYENDAALGLSCTETTRNAAANELYGKSFNDLSEAQKQLTLLKMVEDANAASGALGQAARESDTWTNQTGNLKQAWTDFQAILGSTILPTAVNFVGEMVKVIENWTVKMPEIINWCKEHETILVILGVAVGAVAVAIGAYTLAENLKNIAVAAGVATEGTATVGMGLYTTATNVATAASSAFGAVMSFITSPITLVILAIGALIAIGITLYKNWDTIKAKCSELWSNITAKFTQIKESVVGKVSEIKSNVVNKFNEIKSGVVQKINDLKSNVTSKFNEIKSAISKPIQTASDTVKGIVDKIKGFFSGMKLEFPNIKLPHFSVKPKGWQIGDLLKGSIPKLGIEWYAKAMNNPMLMTKPTIFGYDSATGKLQGGGEKGSEVVSGTNTLMSMIGQVIEGKTAAQNEKIIALLTALLNAIVGGNQELLQALLAGHVIQLNGREFGRAVKEYA